MAHCQLPQRLRLRMAGRVLVENRTASRGSVWLVCAKPPPAGEFKLGVVAGKVRRFGRWLVARASRSVSVQGGC